MRATPTITRPATGLPPVAELNQWLTDRLGPWLVTHTTDDSPPEIGSGLDWLTTDLGYPDTQVEAAYPVPVDVDGSECWPDIEIVDWGREAATGCLLHELRVTRPGSSEPSWHVYRDGLCDDDQPIAFYVGDEA